MADDKKWKLVEKVVAAAFDEPNVTIKRNARLRSMRRKGGKGGYREIDVLITGELIGQKVHFAIECKDYKRKVDSHHIDAFIGKLQDIGLATQTSIFVTTRGYTAQAIERANEVGMKTLVLKDGQNDDKEKILHAIQSHIFLLCSVTEIELKSDLPLDLESMEHFKYFNKSNEFLGFLPDFIWASWVRGTPPSKLGKYSYRLRINDDSNYVENGTKSSINYIRVDFEVTALIWQFKGEANRLHLLDAHRNQTERFKITADFSTSAPTPHHLRTENDMREFLANDSAIAKIEFPRLKLPKIVMNHGMLWPLPSKVIETFQNISPENAEQEFIKLAQSTGNDFFTFDAAYEDLIAKIPNFETIPFEMEQI